MKLSVELGHTGQTTPGTVWLILLGSGPVRRLWEAEVPVPQPQFNRPDVQVFNLGDVDAWVIVEAIEVMLDWRRAPEPPRLPGRSWRLESLKISLVDDDSITPWAILNEPGPHVHTFEGLHSHRIFQWSGPRPRPSQGSIVAGLPAAALPQELPVLVVRPREMNNAGQPYMPRKTVRDHEVEFFESDRSVARYFSVASHGRTRLVNAGVFETNVNGPRNAADDHQRIRWALAELASHGFDFSRFALPNGAIPRERLALIMIDGDEGFGSGQCRTVGDVPIDGTPYRLGGRRVSFVGVGTDNYTRTHETAHQIISAEDLYGLGEGRLNLGMTLMSDAQVPLDPWHRMAAGWLKVDVINLVDEARRPAGVWRLARSERPPLPGEAGSLLIYDPRKYDPRTKEGEYFVCEYRSAVNGGFERPGRNGLAIWQVQTESGGWIIDQGVPLQGYSNNAMGPNGARATSYVWTAADGDIRLRYINRASNSPGQWTNCLLKVVASDGETLQLRLSAENEYSEPLDLGTEVGYWRPGDGTWAIRKRDGTEESLGQFGTIGDIPVPGDWDGDGELELAVFRPAEGRWYFRRRREGEADPPPIDHGKAGDIPVPEDYSGDGKLDAAVFRRAESTWYIRGVAPVEWPVAGGTVVPGRYTNSEKADLATFGPDGNANGSDQRWRISAGLQPLAIREVHFGAENDWPVPGDYSHNGDVDKPAVYRAGAATWYESGGPPLFPPWGDHGLLPIPGAFDPGSDQISAGVWSTRDLHWWIHQRTGFQRFSFGEPGDYLFVVRGRSRAAHVVETPPQLWHVARVSDERWQDFGKRPGEIIDVAAAAADGVVHVCQLSPAGGFLHSIHHPGSMPPWEDPVPDAAFNSGAPFKKIACAGLGSSLHVIGLQANRGLLHTERLPSHWTAPVAIPIPPGLMGPILEISISTLAGMLITLVTDGQTIHGLNRDQNGAWTVGLPIPIQRGVRSIASASVGNDLHYCVVTGDNSLWHGILNHQLPQRKGDLVQQVACSEVGGDLHVCAVSLDSVLIHGIRRTVSPRWEGLNRQGNYCERVACAGFGPALHVLSASRTRSHV